MKGAEDMDKNSFKQPSVYNKPVPFWSWNDKLENDELVRQIDEMADKGWGGFFMHTRVGLVTEYLSEDWFEKINLCAKTAGEKNILAWLYDEDKWPSGFAGGEVAENEEYRDRALVLLRENQIEDNDTVFTDYTYGGIKYYIAKRVSKTGKRQFNGTSYVDLMNPKAVRKFLECTHERYKEHCGQHFGKEIPGVFTDEPCYLMFNDYSVPVLPWSEYLPGFFMSNKHYEIEKHLVELFFDVGDYKRIRYDFFDCASNLMVNSFTKQYYEWCDKNNLKFTGHMMAENNLTYSIQWCGSIMPHYEFMHWPGIDKLSRNTLITVAVKQLSSVAEQLDKERALCEVFGCIGQQSAFAERKWIADWEAVLGITFVNQHLSLYSMKGERKRDYPANLFFQQPWWKDEKVFSDYVSRLCYLAVLGKREVKVLVIHTLGSAWCEYNPVSKNLSGFDYSDFFQKLTDKLIEEKIDFHYGDESIMERHAYIKNGKITIGGYSYTHVLVPAALTLKENTVDLLKKTGGSVIFITPVPDRIDGAKDDDIIPDGAFVVNSINEAIECLPRDITVTDRLSGKNAKKIMCSSKISGTDKIVLAVNNEETRDVNVRISVPETRQPYVLDMMSGETYTCPYEISDGCVIINAKMYAKGSAAFLFTDETPKAQPCRFLETGVLFGGQLEIKEKITDFDVSLTDLNVMPVNDASLYIDGKCVTENAPVSLGWQAFYDTKDGTPFEAVYKFNCVSVPESPVYMAIEAAEYLDRITVNGKNAAPLKEKGEKTVYDPEVNYLDTAFYKIDITGLVSKGENTVYIYGKKVNNVVCPGFHIRANNKDNAYNTTEFESIYIIGDFAVENENDERFSISAEKPKLNPDDIVKSGYPFYAGRMIFEKEITFPDDGCMLRLNGVHAASAVVKIDGKPISTQFLQPFLIDLKGISGRHHLAVELADTLFNLMGPNRVDNVLKMRNISPLTFVNTDLFTEKYSFTDFGMESADIVK